MAQYYECMRCRTVTALQALPARCEKCGGGTGVVFTKEDAGPAPAVSSLPLPQHENVNPR